MNELARISPNPLALADGCFKRSFTKIQFESLEQRRLLSIDLVATTGNVNLAASPAGAIRVDQVTQSDGTTGYRVINADGSIGTTFVATDAGGTITVGGGLISFGGASTPPAVKPVAKPVASKRDAADMEIALGTVVQSDGKVLVASLLGKMQTDRQANSGQTFDRIALVRYLADGSIDTTFGTGGYSTYTLSTPTMTDYWQGSVVEDGHGGILVAYYSGMVRFGADGSLDTTFANNGTFVSSALDAMKVQADGKIVGLADDTIFRLNADGSKDDAFTAYQLKVPGSNWSRANLHDFAFATDGSIYVVGEIRTNLGASGLEDVAMTTGYLTKLHSDGTVDTSFANNGRYELGQANRKWEAFNTVAVLPDGKIQVVGKYSHIEPKENPFDPGDHFADIGGVVFGRFNPDGSLDGSFGNGGLAIDPDLSVADIFGMVMLPDGRIVATTYGDDGATLLVANADGSSAHLVQQKITFDHSSDPNYEYVMATRVPTIAPDGSIVVGVGMADLHYQADRSVSETYWARFGLDELDGTPPVVKAPEAPGVKTPEVTDIAIDKPNTPPSEPSETPAASLPSTGVFTGSVFATRLAYAGADVLCSDAKDTLFSSDEKVLA